MGGCGPSHTYETTSDEVVNFYDVCGFDLGILVDPVIWDTTRPPTIIPTIL
jgi:hypothetical protein